MTSVKEPQLFAGEGYPEALARYATLFDRPAAVRGESSAVYSQFPGWPGIPERISEQAADARFVYVVRDPIERAVAHYRQHVRDFKEGRGIAEALADLEEPNSTYVAPSRYATQLRRYLELFDADRILVVDQRGLLDDRRATLERIFAFLQVDPSFDSADFDARLNTADHLRRPTRVGAALRRAGVVQRASRLPVPGRVRRRLRAAVSRPIEAPDLPADLRARLADALGDEVGWLRRFTGMHFDHWSL
jgi:Sulfotransferase family